MWPIAKRARVYIALTPVDMRKSFNGLSTWVAAELDRTPTSGDLFVFANRQRRLVKILYYHKNGFCIWSKKLIKHRFKWPEDAQDALEFQKHELAWLLEGLDPRQAHEKLVYDTVY